MRSSTTVDDELPLARVESLRDNLRVIPTAAFCDREQNRLIARQYFGPTVAALFLALGQRLRCAAGSRNMQQSRAGIGRINDRVLRCPHGPPRSCTGIAQRDNLSAIHCNLL